MAVVSREVAQHEIDGWLEYKKVPERKRESFKDSVDALVDAVSDGCLSVDGDTHVITQTLKFPVGSEVHVDKLDWKPRLSVSNVHTHLQGVKATDADGRVLAYMAALTGKPKEVIRSLDTEDYSIGQAIAIFFL